MNIKSINRESMFDFWDFMRSRNSTISPNTLNKYKDVVQFVLKNECNIILTIRDLPEIEVITEPLPVNVINIVFRYFESLPPTPINMRNHLIFRMLYDTGVRVSELLSFRTSNIDFDTSTILVKVTKTKKERYTFFTADTYILLLNYLKETLIDDYIFIDFRTGKTLTVNSIETICTRLRKKLRLTQSISPHKWRHTFGTRFQRKHGDLEVTRKILGHSNITQTQKYVHLTKDDLHNVYFRGVTDRRNSRSTHGVNVDIRSNRKK